MCIGLRETWHNVSTFESAFKSLTLTGGSRFCKIYVR